MRRPEELPVLIAEIDDEIFKLKSLVQKLAEQQGKLTTEEMVESAALRLHNFYTGCERIFKLIAKDVNGTVPETIDWHKRLLTQMSLDVTDVRPAVVSKDTRAELEELLGFRHVVRNLYGYELEAERVDKLVGVVSKLFPRFEKEIAAFLDFLRELHGDI